MPLRDVKAAVLEVVTTLGSPAIRCPACTRRVRSDPRKIDSSMAHALWRIYEYDRDHPGQWMDYRNWIARGEPRTHTLMRHPPWGLIEPRDVKTGPAAGWWRITERGKQFVTQGLRVPYRIYTFNQECWGQSKTRTTSMREALADKFDLDELLGRTPRK